jgi:tRNA(adenine34) deaminase
VGTRRGASESGGGSTGGGSTGGASAGYLSAMRLALAEAAEAAAADDHRRPGGDDPADPGRDPGLPRSEVPVGAVVLSPGGDVLARAHNQRERDADPTAHAEILAIRAAARALGSWRLEECTLVVTLEPCPMCAGAVVAARIGRVVYGAADPKAGAAGSLWDIPRDRRLNHRAEVIGGVLAEESAALLRGFFARRRSGRLDGGGVA